MTALQTLNFLMPVIYRGSTSIEARRNQAATGLLKFWFLSSRRRILPRLSKTAICQTLR
jgi:hypothetical protein